MNTLDFLSLLPSALGLCGFLVYLLWTANRPPSLILLEILSLIKERKGKFPELDGRLSGTQVYNVIRQHPEFREALSDREFQLVEGVRKGESKERLIALASVVFLTIVSIAAYTYSQTRKPLSPIHEISLSGEARKTATFASEKDYIEQLTSAFDELTDQDGGLSRTLDLGVFRRQVSGISGSAAGQNTAFFISPTSPLAPSKLELATDEDDIAILDFLIISLKLFKNPPDETISAIVDGEADLEIQVTLLHQPHTQYLLFGVDLGHNQIIQRFDSVRPDKVHAKPSIQNWEDLRGMHLYAHVSVPMATEHLFLAVGSDQRPHYVIEPSDFQRIDMQNSAGAPVTFFKTTLSKSMANRSSTVRVVDRLR